MFMSRSLVTKTVTVRNKCGERARYGFVLTMREGADEIWRANLSG